MTSEQILNEELNFIVVDLKAKHIELGMKASGRWVESLSVETAPTKGTIFGEDYTEFLVDGRKPGKFPPIDMIKKWIVDKGIQSDISINSLAFLIARKISREGTKYHQQGGTDLIDAVITPSRIDGIINRIGNELMLELVFVLERTFKETA